VAVFGGAAIALSGIFYLPLTLLAPLQQSAATVLPYVAPPTAAPELEWPTYGASAIGAVGYPGTLASSGSTESLPIASITKVITALVVLEKHPLGVDETGPQIAFTSKDVQLYNSYLARNGKVESVRSGMVLTQRQVLELTLVASANNYTASLMNWAYGSEAEFLAAATPWLGAHGLSGISLADGTGMSPLNTATAPDLVELGKLALGHPLVSLLVSTTDISIPRVGEIDNTNELLGLVGVRGIKTGTLDEAGACLLFAADYVVGSETVTVIGVMLGGATHPSLNQDIVELLAGVENGFQEVVLATAGVGFGSYETDWGETSEVVAATSASTVIWGDTPVSLLVETEDVILAEAGTDVGTLHFSVGNRAIDVQIELVSALEDPGPWWRLSHPAELF
jgi:D-alanyl-D-alanine carboxypeptidase (penicillin-binding protein 5/6)